MTLQSHIIHWHWYKLPPCLGTLCRRAGFDLQARVVELISPYVAVPIQVEERKGQIGSVACHFGSA